MKEEGGGGSNSTVIEAIGGALNIVSMTGVLDKLIHNSSLSLKKNKDFCYAKNSFMKYFYLTI